MQEYTVYLQGSENRFTLKSYNWGTFKVLSLKINYILNLSKDLDHIVLCGDAPGLVSEKL